MSLSPHPATQPPTPFERPWYRQPLVWLVISFPLAAVIGGFFTLYLAIESDDGLVVDDYYKQGLAINADLGRDHRATELGLAADLQFTADGGLRLMMSSSNRNSVPMMLMRLRLSYPTRDDRDRVLVLTPAADGSYSAQVDELERGHWRLSLESEGGDWRLTGRALLPGPTQVSLKARPAPATR